MQLWHRVRTWKLTRRGKVIAGGIVGLLLVGLAQIDYACDWTGFGVCQFPNGIENGYRPEKTLWDWLGLLIVPSVLALGAVYFNRTERQNELIIAEQRVQTEREIADDRLREEALQTYLDRMSELLLENKLRKSNPDAEVRSVARARTLTVLRRLDGSRKGAVLQFLHESNLIRVDDTVISLDQADLKDVTLLNAGLEAANLEGTDLRGANIAFTNLAGTNFQGADLEGAELCFVNLRGSDFRWVSLKASNFKGTDLGGSNFEGADLFEAKFQSVNLHNANVTQAQLNDAASLGMMDLAEEFLSAARSKRS